jgi:hypothetical protein
VLLPFSNCNMGFYKSYSLQQHDSGEAQRLAPERPLASCGRCLGRRPDGARQAPQWLRLASMGVQRHPTAVTLRSGSLGGTDVRALPLLAASRIAARAYNYTSPALNPLDGSLRVI